MNQVKLEHQVRRPTGTDEGEQPPARPYYRVVRDDLARNILNGELQPGVVLLEGPIATLLGVSRGPVQRALELMAQEGLVHRFNGRGYLVGAASSGVEPIRVNLLTLNLDVSGDIQGHAQRAAWQRIYGEVADRVLSCCPFGAYKISESVMCAHFDVSRTVVRDVLNRLNHDGLIEKDRWSHWTAGPLTSRDVKEHFEIRALLEPAALQQAAGSLAPHELRAMKARLEQALRAPRSITPAEIERLERDMHETCLAGAANRRLISSIQRSRTPDVVDRLFARQVGLQEVEVMLREHGIVLDSLMAGDLDGAVGALALHLGRAMQRTKARLKVLSVLADQQTAPYLTPLADGRSRTRKAQRQRSERRRAAPRRPALRVLGRREILLEPLRREAARDLGFDVEFELVDGAEEIRRAVTRPDSFDVYHQWHTVDLLWTARSIQPIEVRRIPAWSDIASLASLTNAGTPVCGDLFRQLYVQRDDTLASRPSALASTAPTIHGADSLGYAPSLRQQLRPDEKDSWAWLLDERWRGKVGMIRDPAIGMIEAALAVEGAGILKFGDIANLSIEEIDAVIAILKERKRNGHFCGLWETYDDAAKLMERSGAVVQSIFSPAIVKLRRAGVEVASAMPVEGARGWHSDICLSAAAGGERLEAAYAYLNWWMEGPPGAILARQGYYMSVRERTRRHLSEAEWDYWYEGKPAARDLPDPFGEACVRAGESRDGGSYLERMARVRVWNTIMEDHNYLVRRWVEFLNA
ncbi:MAG TPA: extracellular solute-binding protein [Roseiarcus sp.]|nr:extracellular solute-binding protein [Roseiarcus sp.]